MLGFELLDELKGKHLLMPKRNGSDWYTNQFEEGTYLVIDAEAGGNAELVQCVLDKDKPCCLRDDASVHSGHIRLMPSKLAGLGHFHFLKKHDPASKDASRFVARALISYNELEELVVAHTIMSEVLKKATSQG